MKNFRKLVVSGSIWNIGASVVRYGFSLVVNVLLARLLVPADFGLIAMATVMSGAVAIVGSLGLGTALVQTKDLTERHLSSVFWVTIVVSLLLAGFTAGSGPIVAWFYGEPQLLQIMPVVALQFPVAALALVPQALLSRELRFQTLAKLSLGAIFVSGVAGVLAAALGAGVWSLLLRELLVHVVTATALMSLVAWRPRWLLDREALRGLFKFSVNYYFTEVLVYASRNLDTILVGKFLGTTPLGIYSRAYTLMTLPMQSVSAAVTRVLFAAFSSIQDDSARVRRVYLQYSGALALYVVPTMLGLASVARPAVIAGLGEDWEALIPIVQIMAPSAIWQGVGAIHRTLYLAKGRTDLRLRYTIVGRAFLLTGIVGGLPFGIIGVATGFVIGSFLNTVISMHGAIRLVGLTWVQMFKHHLGVVLASTVMAAVVVGVGRLPELLALDDWLQLLTLVAVGVVVYGTAIMLIRPAPYRDVRALIDRRRKKAP